MPDRQYSERPPGAGSSMSKAYEVRSVKTETVYDFCCLHYLWKVIRGGARETSGQFLSIACALINLDLICSDKFGLDILGQSEDVLFC